MNGRALLVIISLLALAQVPLGQATPVDEYNGVRLGADRLLVLQHDNGAFPWLVGDTTEYQNVQGLTALGLLEAYKVTLDPRYLGNATSGAMGTATWLQAHMDADSDPISSANIFFLGEYATVTLDATVYAYAEDAIFRIIERFDGATQVIGGIISARVAEGNGNLGLWDAALYIRAASDIGWEQIADDWADDLKAQTLVDPYDDEADWYELGLAGLIFGLAESDAVLHLATIDAARSALAATQCDTGSFPITYGGTRYCDQVQATAYAVWALSYVLDARAMRTPCGFIEALQTTVDDEYNGGWDLGGYEIAEVDAEATVALAACAAPINNQFTSYIDGARVALG